MNARDICSFLNNCLRLDRKMVEDLVLRTIEVPKEKDLGGVFVTQSGTTSFLGFINGMLKATQHDYVVAAFIDERESIRWFEPRELED